jgi:hypothetical protein
MSVMKWLKELVFGKNGFDAKAHEAEVTQIKKRTEACQDETTANFGRMQVAFGELSDTEEIKPSEHPSV